MNASDIVIAIVLQVVLIFLNAVFAAAEIAVISVNGTKMQKMAEEGDKRAKRIVKLTERPSKFLSTIQVSITLAALLGSAFAADSFAEPLAEALISAGLTISKGVLQTICLIVITIILSFFSIVFGELIPKRIAMRYAEKYSLAISGLLQVVSVVFAPIVWLLTVSANGILRLFGIKAEDEGEQVTEEEIMLMAEAGSEKGSIDKQENEFIQNIFEFKENDVGEVCTHRKDVDFLFLRDDQSVWEDTIGAGNHTYYPVCDRDVDDVIGILNTKIYFRMKDKSRESVMENAVMSPVFVSETMPADDLFYRMKRTRDYFAVVLDEYGGINGIITLHDLIELLVGDLNEKGEKLKFEIRQVTPNEWEIDGLAPFDDVAEAIGLKLSEEDAEDYETFGGYVCELLGSVPEDGTTASADTDEFRIDVLSVEEHRIEKMRVIKKIPAEQDDEEKENEDEKKFRLFKSKTSDETEEREVSDQNAEENLRKDGENKS